MTFMEILEYAEKRGKIRRKEWPFDSFLILSITRRMLLDRWGDIRILTIEDYKADDWEVYKDKEIEYFDFHQALKHLEEGKRVSRKKWTLLNSFNKYIFISQDVNKLYTNNNQSVILSDLDILAKDWYIVEGK